jgi:hypothetical protein
MKSRHDRTDPSRPDPIGPDLRSLFRAGAPAEPSEAEWSALLDGVQRGLDRPRVTPVPAGSRWRLSIMAAATLAAALALALAVPSFRDQPGPAIDHERADVAAFPVTDRDDVEILSVDADDSRAIVVGDLPLRGPIVLMEPGDVALRSLERGPQGEFPDVHMQAETEQGPMIWAPLAANP